jgi:hypothetical protein
MKTSSKAMIITAVLGVDGLFHAYWATGSTWPAKTPQSLSEAVLNTHVPFRPQLVLPLAALLWTTSGLILARSSGRGGRLAGVVSAAAAVGLGVRGLAGLVWITGFGTQPGHPFYWLNIFVYTPACLLLTPLAANVARGHTASRGPRDVGRSAQEAAER